MANSGISFFLLLTVATIGFSQHRFHPFGQSFATFYKNVFIRAVPTPEPEVDLQQMFTDIFNFNKNIANDPRFSDCPAPNISAVTQALPASGFFFGLNPNHRMATMMIRRFIMGGKNLRNTICIAGILRDLPGLNPNIWVRGVFGAHMTHSELFNLEAPSLVEVVPNLFLNRETLQAARQQGSLDPARRQCALVDGRVGVDNGIENLLWYFREDLGVNNFHLNWHLIYPINAAVKADRQGELFYFSHHGHLARYHAERLANGLAPATPLHLDYETPIRENYNPHLDDTNAGMSWTPRSGNRFPSDTLFENMPGMSNFITVANQTILIQRVQDSILQGGLPMPDGRTLILDSRTGIDFLGDLVEATAFTINGDYFSSFGFHNEGHVLIGFVEDPANRTRLPPGVMAEVATAMRDPVFYRYHTTVDQVFDLHKQLLPPYLPEGGEFPLRWDGIEIMHTELVEENAVHTNRLSTFYSQRTFELSRGLDFQGSGIQGSVGACVMQLNHSPFAYRIFVNRDPTSRPMATVRIFMAPRYNEQGLRYTLVEQRHHFFMMDLFTVSLQPGLNMISRQSTESALTLSNNHCGCGWPHNLLLPRGTEDGMAFDVFVMLTNTEEDAVSSNRPSPSQSAGCVPAPIYCGRMNDTYPDARPMGYPFDRLPYGVVTVARTTVNGKQVLENRFVHDLEEFTAHVPNMASVEVVIKHSTTPQQTTQTRPPSGVEAPRNPSETQPQQNLQTGSAQTQSSAENPSAVGHQFIQFENTNVNSSHLYYYYRSPPSS